MNAMPPHMALMVLPLLFFYAYAIGCSWVVLDLSSHDLHIETDDKHGRRQHCQRSTVVLKRYPEEAQEQEQTRNGCHSPLGSAAAEKVGDAEEPATRQIPTAGFRRWLREAGTKKSRATSVPG
ncbi:hypothetical protein C8R45DRAFT_927702 [Mycena sanguinolenta]|nr:hypothetical protein C8R45DRAFT_927702 [Mycena sanguinolenta]